MSEKLFEMALGIRDPWFIKAVSFDEQARVLKISVDFVPGSRFAIAGEEGTHPVHDTVTKTYRHLNFFQHECLLEVRTPRVRTGEGSSVRMAEAPFAGHMPGFTLLFEALVLVLAQQMPFAAVARIVGLSAHRVQALCGRYVSLALAQADFSEVTSLAIDETSRRRGQDYVTLAADAQARRVVFVTEGRDAAALERLARDLAAHGCPPEQVRSVSIDMSAAFIRGCREHLPNARITFDKFHVIAHASQAVDKTRREEQRAGAPLKGLRWALLKDTSRLGPEELAELGELVAQMDTLRTAKAWLYKEQLRGILERKQPNVVLARLRYWCTCVLRSKVEPMKEVARMVKKHLEGIAAWTQTRQTNGYLEAVNGLFQAAKRRARGFVRMSTIRTVIFLIAGKLDFSAVNAHVGTSPENPLKFQ